ILLPALGRAREAARQTVCAASMRSVVQALTQYETENKKYPASYYYPSTTRGVDWRESDQLENNPNPGHGYVHWSWFLFDEESGASDEAFLCPTTTNGGAPRTNPGPNPEDWEPNQEDDLGNTWQAPADIPEDRQVRRCAFTANAAVIPRNKFAQPSGRSNQFVKFTDIEQPSRVIAFTEFLDSPDWKSLREPTTPKIKSHRPVTPFIGLSSGSDVYSEPTLGSGAIARFAYPSVEAIYDERDPALRGENLINDPNTTLNAVGRHHIGGKANFTFLDGHVESYTIRDTVEKRLWGDRFWSISGNNRVRSKIEEEQFGGQ
ncbi:MAG: DUF1559 domain-containing protein, partial [Planctomycetota bacterium]|nr:DUF1559 domain-containing protein [Planctomycetota bacterium]